MLGLAERGMKRLAYGLWRFAPDDLDNCLAMLKLARESGIDHLDTADVYGKGTFGGAESLLGVVRKTAPSLLDGAMIATKAGCQPGSPYNSSPAYLTNACDASLKRLGVARIDLFYIHRPDFLSHPADVAGALDKLVEAGKIASVGVSNYTTAQIEALTRYLRAPLRAHQVEFSPAHVAPLYDGTADQAMKKKFPLVAWSPLAGGRLTDEGPADLAKSREVLAHLAARYGVTPAAIAIAFLMAHPAPVTPILGTTNPDHLREALAGASVSLERADWYAVVEAARGQRMP